MATLLDEVLKFHAPCTWDTGSYDDRRYKKVQVFGYEHNQVIKNFTPELTARVQLIYRVQNPYIYGRYRLNVEKLQLTGPVVEETWYHPIAEDDMEIVMEYNCDYRRYTRITSAQCFGKNPMFYKSAERAQQNCPGYLNLALVVVKVVSTHTSTAEECSKNWDTEYYPEYVVVLHD